MPHLFFPLLLSKPARVISPGRDPNIPIEIHLMPQTHDFIRQKMRDLNGLLINSNRS
jgi:hypothetical protein